MGYFDHQEEEVRSIVDQVQAMEAPEQKPGIHFRRQPQYHAIRL